MWYYSRVKFVECHNPNKFSPSMHKHATFVTRGSVNQERSKKEMWARTKQCFGSHAVWDEDQFVGWTSRLEDGQKVHPRQNTRYAMPMKNNL